jgi:hypothetical protein
VTLLLGEARRRSALHRIRDFARQQQRAREIVQQARENRRRGCVDLPGAFLLILLGIALLIFAIYLVAGPPGA